MDREEGIAVLGGRGWLAGVPADFRNAVLGLCRWRHLDAGTSIATGGDEAGDLIGLASGAVEMTTVLGVPETPVMFLARPVRWFGYGPMVFGRRRRVTSVARSDVWLGSAPQPAFMRLMARRPEWWRHVLPLVLDYSDITLGLAADLLIRRSDRRCAAVLMRLAGMRPAEPDIIGPVEIPITQEELAGSANLSANTTRAILKSLAERRLIALGYRSITLLDPAALRAFVEA